MNRPLRAAEKPTERRAWFLRASWKKLPVELVRANARCGEVPRTYPPGSFSAALGTTPISISLESEPISVPAPDFESGEAGFQTRENAPSWNDWALVRTNEIQTKALAWKNT